MSSACATAGSQQWCRGQGQAGHSSAGTHSGGTRVLLLPIPQGIRSRRIWETQLSNKKSKAEEKIFRKTWKGNPYEEVVDQDLIAITNFRNLLVYPSLTEQSAIFCQKGNKKMTRVYILLVWVRTLLGRWNIWDKGNTPLTSTWREWDCHRSILVLRNPGHSPKGQELLADRGAAWDTTSLCHHSLPTSSCTRGEHKTGTSTPEHL